MNYRRVRLVLSLSYGPRAGRAAGTGFHEVYDIATCEKRDHKDFCARARLVEIPDSTGISALYESPESCKLVVDSNNAGIDE